jgi:flagellar biosynthesis/type III secretory pathway protein FliH
MILQQEYREKYNEGLEAGIEKGIEQGLERGIKILYCDIHMTILEIAAKMSMTEQQVEKIVEKFGKIEEK